MIRLSDDSEFSYDYLIASPGTESHWSVPGATPYWGPAGNEAVTEAVARLRDREGVKVVVTMPENGSWPLSLCELALLISTELDSGASTTIVTPERPQLELFGKVSAEKVAALLRNGNIETLLETAPAEYRDGVPVTTDGRQIEADLAITLPLLTGRRIPGLPSDRDDTWRTCAGPAHRYRANGERSKRRAVGASPYDEAEAHLRRRDRTRSIAAPIPIESIPTSRARPCRPLTKLWWYSSVIA